MFETIDKEVVVGYEEHIWINISNLGNSTFHILQLIDMQI